MQSTLTVSIRLDARKLATLLRAALSSGALETSAPRGSPKEVSIANLIRLAVASTTKPFKGSEVEVTSLPEAWAVLSEHGVGGQQRRKKPKEMGTLPATTLGDVVFDLSVEQTPQPIDNDALTVLESIAQKRRFSE